MGKFNITSYDIYCLDLDAEKKLWADCVFIFDTSALLAFYKLPRKIQISFEKVFTKLKGRLWLPNHVQFEFCKNRETTADQLRKAYADFYSLNIQELDTQMRNLKESINTLDPSKPNKLPPLAFSISQYSKIMKQMELLEDRKKKFRDECKKHFDKQKELASDLLSNDKVLGMIKKHFSVGDPYSHERVVDITKEGIFRYQSSIPPGYKDVQKKEGTQKYGDLIIWKQIIELAREAHKSVIFVTNDIDKGDWGIVKNKSFKSPLHDLVTEFYDATRSRFWLYTLRDFLFKTDANLGILVPEDQLQQVSQTICEPESTLKIKYRCNKCRRISIETIDTNDLEFESADSFNRSMGFERQYEASTEVMCSHCQNLITVDITGWEYPEGSPIAIDVDLDGAKLLWSSDFIQRTEDHWDEICQDRYTEIIIGEIKDR